MRIALAVFLVIAAFAGCGGSGRKLAAEEARRGYLGLEGFSVRPRAARLLHLPASHGLLVYCVRPGLAADRAGIRAGHLVLFGKTYWPVGGDLIVRVNGKRLVDRDHLFRLLGRTRPGDSLRLQIYRGSRRIRVAVVLGSSDAAPSCTHLPRIAGQGFPPP